MSDSRPLSIVNKKRRESAGTPSSDADSIKVICRFRPARAQRKDQVATKSGKYNLHSDSFNLNDETGEVEFSSDYQESKRFKFDKIFGGDSTQADIFGEVNATVDFVMSGFNGAVLAYGQTSAGKSWTMEGPSIWDSECQGVVPRCVDKLFEDIDKAASTIQFQIVVSYYEIYCEKVRDLLNPTQTNMKVRETKADGFIVQDVTEIYCTDKESVLRVIELGKTNRIAAPTLMNAESSRSHSIFSILVDQQDTANGRHKKGILYLVDLAGSEKVGKTGAKGIRLEEAKNINSSLTSLGMVINALCDRAPHVPYRDSKLTMLLMEALGGNSKTTLIICCNPEHDHSPETLSTLRFGERAKHIQTNAHVNEELSASELKVHLAAAKKELANLVGVLGKASSGIGEAISTSSAINLGPLHEFLKKHLARLGGKGTAVGDLTLDGEDGIAAGDQEGPDEAPFGGSQSVKQKPLDQSDLLSDLSSKVTSLEEEVELEKLKFEKEHEMCMFKNTEVSALQATIVELEEKLLKANLTAKRAQEAKEAAEELLNSAGNISITERTISGSLADSTSPKARGRSSSFLSRSASSPTARAGENNDTDGGAASSETYQSSPDRKEAGIAAENREFLLKLERELIATGTNFEKDGTLRETTSGSDPLQAYDQAAAKKDGGEADKANQELMNFLEIGEGELGTPLSDADAQKHVKEVYATHVRRLMFILDQEQQARLRVEDKLDDMKMQMVRQSNTNKNEGKSKGFLQNLFSGGGGGGSGTSASNGGNTSTLSSISNMVADTISPIRNRQSSVGAGSFPPTAEENARRFGYNDREAALAETLEIAQDRIMELVTEMESTQEAQMIVLETKESVLRSLARQNTHLAMERDALNQKVESLTAKTEQLSTLLRSVQQVQVQVQQGLPAPGSVTNQSFRVGGGTVQRTGAGRGLVALDTSDPTTGVHNASFRMGGKPPITPSTTGGGGGFTAPRTPLFFNGGGTIQRNRNAAPPANRVSPQVTFQPPTSPSSASFVSDSTYSSCDDLTRLDSPTGANANPSLIEDHFGAPAGSAESPVPLEAVAEVAKDMSALSTASDSEHSERPALKAVEPVESGETE